MSDPDGTGAYVSPGDGVLPGALIEAMARKPSAFSDEHFAGVSVGTTSQQGYTTINPGGYVVSDIEPPVNGDTVSRGLMRATLTPNAVAVTSGFRRQHFIGGTGMFPAAPSAFWLAVRFKMLSAIPTAADDYGITPAGIGNVGVHPPLRLNGTRFWFDRTLGVEQYVIVSVRAGVQAPDLPLGLTFAQSLAGFNTLTVRIQGNTRVGYLNGVVAGQDSATEVQPGDPAGAGHAAVVASLNQIALALSFSPIILVDRIVWGQA